MPNQHHESHHKICNLRYGTPVRGGVSMGKGKNQTAGVEFLWIVL